MCYGAGDGQKLEREEVAQKNSIGQELNFDFGPFHVIYWAHYEH